MARPYWSGRIQVSLVSFGVQLYVATETKNQISFHQISRSTGERIRHQKVLASAVESDGDVAGAAVAKDEIVKGYEHRKGEYILIEPSELENLKVPSKHTIDVSQFVTMDELRPEYVEKPYYVVPDNDSQAMAAATRRSTSLTAVRSPGAKRFRITAIATPESMSAHVADPFIPTIPNAEPVRAGTPPGRPGGS